MIFLSSQSTDNIDRYKHLLKMIGALSFLFSEKDEPYLYYRVAENIFCSVFNALNLARSDVSVDASKDNMGIGLKTFLEVNGRTFQKIGEFNKSRELYSPYETKPVRLIKKIAALRNKRVESTKSLHNLEETVYHCVTRSRNKFYIFEENMPIIDISNLQIVNKRKNSIQFTDRNNEYIFNFSKSTLFKRFVTLNPIEIEIDIFEDPISLMDKLFNENQNLLRESHQINEKIFLPLYSRKGNIHVSEKSGLNQWNASGRSRHSNEVYIPIPTIINEKFPNFFPPRERIFNLILPNKKTISSKICQDNDKALMSNPNSALGRWLLRDVLKLDEGVLVTYDKLLEIGIDAVEIEKIDNNEYEINFKSIGTYEDFLIELTNRG